MSPASNRSTATHLTLAMIVKDAATRLPLVLGSLRSDVDAVLIGVDDRSSDGTADVANALRATVIPFRWDDDLAAARNAVLDHIADGWVWWIDDDERVIDDPGNVRNRLAATSGPAARLTRVEASPDDALRDPTRPRERHMRFFRKDVRLRCIGRYHEFPVDQALAIARDQGTDIPLLPLTLAHIPPTPAQLPDKLRRNARLMERDLIDRPGRVGYTAELARTLLRLGDPAGHDRMADAGRLLMSQLAADPDPPRHIVDRNLPLLLEYALSRAAGPLTPMEAERLSLRWFDDVVPLLWLIARRRYAAGDVDRAAELLVRIRRLAETGRLESGGFGFDRRLLGGQLALNLAACRINQGRLSEARALLAEAERDAATRDAAITNRRLLDTQAASHFPKDETEAQD